MAQRVQRDSHQWTLTLTRMSGSNVGLCVAA
jgi:hypothetical protein